MIAINTINKTFTASKGKLKYTFWRYFEVILSKQCLRLGPFIIIMQKAWFEIYLRFIRNDNNKSDSRRIQGKLIFSLAVYRRHGNVDFPKKKYSLF